MRDKKKVCVTCGSTKIHRGQCMDCRNDVYKTWRKAKEKHEIKKAGSGVIAGPCMSRQYRWFVKAF